MAVKVPTYDRLINPCFMAIKALGGSASNEEIYDEVIRQLSLPESVLEVQQTGHLGMSKVSYNLAWARTYLKKFGAIINTARSIWTISSEFSDIEAVDARKVVEIVKSLEAQSINKKTQQEQRKIEKDLIVSEDEQPEEVSSWRLRMLEILQNMNPYGFERFVQLLLRNCGIDNVEVTKKSGDGGIDGTGQYKLSGIFSFKLAFQCKRYTGNVGTGEIRDFRGSLSTDIEKAIFVTTGSFSPAAKSEAKAPGKKPIDLMDGEMLIDKIAELKLGVSPKTVYEIDDKFYAQYNE
ncbi:MAG: restriction endonuclease [Clostridia bacterium]|nr:restriction endonuclease [Clostridia bacterium]MDE6471420.1 restriction endonuclease [Clostridia bacterium]